MNPFEYVTVLVSIILGLGIAQILTGIADLIHQNDRVKVYWPHLLWILLVLILHVQEWWVTYDLRHYTPWRLPVFLFVMLYPVNLFILARLLFPFGLHDEVVDLKAFYFHNYRKIFLFGGILVLLALADSIFIRPIEVKNFVAQSVLLLLLIYMCVKKAPAPWAHKAFPVIMLVILLVAIAIEWNEWLIAD
jgi:hypothetical protein